MKKRDACLCLVAVVSVYLYQLMAMTPKSFAEGLDTLIEVGRAQSDIAKENARETKAYESVRRAVESGQLREGMKQDDVLKRFGDPVVSFDRTGTEPAKLIYIPANASFFDGPKVYLFFDDKGFLSGTKIVDKGQKEEPAK